MTQPTSLIPQFAVMAVILAWGLAPGEWMPDAGLRVRETLRRNQMNRADYERMERGYYEELLDVGRQLGTLDAPPPPVDPPFSAGPLIIHVDDPREYILRPGLATEHVGASWTTNSWGLRDREYARRKPEGTFRIALLGDSIGVGWGVNDDQGFEPILERWFHERSRAAGGPAVEILNFAVPGHAPGQRWENFERVGGWSLGPDLVLYEATAVDPGWDDRRLRVMLPRGLGWDSSMYRDVLERAGVTPGGDPQFYRQALRPYRRELLEHVYRTIVAQCRAQGVPVIWVLIPRVGRPDEMAARHRLIDLARRSGFDTVIDLSDTFDGIDPESLAIAPTDYHPNAEGHARLARRLDEALSAHPELSRLWTTPPGTNTPSASGDPTR